MAGGPLDDDDGTGGRQAAEQGQLAHDEAVAHEHHQGQAGDDGGSCHDVVVAGAANGPRQQTTHKRDGEPRRQGLARGQAAHEDQQRQQAQPGGRREGPGARRQELKQQPEGHHRRQIVKGQPGGRHDSGLDEVLHAHGPNGVDGANPRVNPASGPRRM